MMPDECVDLVVTSPPYDDLRVYSGYSFEFESIAKELYRVMKKGGVVVWVVGDKINNGNRSLTCFMQCLYFQEIGFNVLDILNHDALLLTEDAVARIEEVFSDEKSA